jgi:predicted nucleic acid-binding protein
VLLPHQLADLLLRLAEVELYEPLWSDAILIEVERNLVGGKFRIPPLQARRRLDHMCSAFPHATVAGYEDLVPVMTNDPKDRHVAAAAVRGNAALIVTANLKDFPPDTLGHYDIEAVHPDDFLQDQLDLAPETTVTCLAEQRAAYTRPQFSFIEFYQGLAKTVPIFADLAAAAETAHWDPNNPLPLEIVSAADSRQAFFPEKPPDPFTPLGAATLWWTCLLDKNQFMVALQNLTWQPAAWGDYEWAANQLDGAGMMQFVERCPDSETITYVKFMPNVEHPMRAFGEVPLAEVHVLTMVLCPDKFWRAWGLSRNYFPTADEVNGSE